MPSVSIVIPSLNESKFIENCLDSIIANNFSFENLEVFVVDGMSQDGTRALIQQFAKKYPFVKLLDNNKRDTPTALNIGITKSTGEKIIILSSHSCISKNFIRTCVSSLEKYDADCVGGVLKTVPISNTSISEAISIALSHRFGVGNSYFRIGTDQVRKVDTVAYGCYDKKVFTKYGLFNEKLFRNQDIEFNLRLKRGHAKIILDPRIVSWYYPRANFGDTFKQYFGNGYWIINSIKYSKAACSLRHFIPLLFGASLCTSLLGAIFSIHFFYMACIILTCYIMANMYTSIKISFSKSIKLIIPLVVAFATIHFSYGLGSMYGIVKYSFRKVDFT